MTKIECPYCETELDIDTTEIYDPDQPEEVKCPLCKSLFHIEVEFIPTYNSYQVPCLNGEDHKWIGGIVEGFPTSYTLYCAYCKEKRPPTPEEYEAEMQKALTPTFSQDGRGSNDAELRKAPSTDLAASACCSTENKEA